jgi:hypothetical protein
MLTGLAPTQAEINAVTADASALSDLNSFRLKRDHRNRATCPAIMCG